MYLSIVFRFGEESLHNCEVMLKDIEDSKRVNTAVYNALKTQAKKATVSILLIVLYYCGGDGGDGIGKCRGYTDWKCGG